MNRQFLAYKAQDTEAFVTKLHTCPLEELYLVTPEYLTPYLSYIREHRRLFHTAMENAAVLGLDSAYARMCRYVLTPILEHYGVPEQNRAYLMTFYIQYSRADGHHHGIFGGGRGLIPIPVMPKTIPCGRASSVAFRSIFSSPTPSEIIRSMRWMTAFPTGLPA